LKTIFTFSSLLLIAALTLQSCTKTPCINATLEFGLISFSDAESDSIILRRYEKGSNFLLVKDTFLLGIHFTRKNDTLEIASTQSMGLMNSQFDYEIYLPNAAKLFRVTSIIEEYREIKHAFWNNVKVGCVNEITRFSLNNATYILPKYNYFYLKK